MELSSLSIKKFILILLVVPASLPWMWMCFLGLAIFAHDLFNNFIALCMTSVALIGFVSLFFAVISVFSFPQISKRTINVCGIGSTILVSSLFMGIASSPLYLYSAYSLLLGSIILIYEYVALNKPFKQDH